jgi:hypothetical protein
MRCLERQHTDRYRSAIELAAVIDEVLASGEEAVTTVDLSHPRNLMTTLKGMRMPVKPPPAAPDAEMLDLLSTGVRASASAATPPPRPTPVPLPATPSRGTPSAHVTPRPRLTPTPQVTALPPPADPAVAPPTSMPGPQTAEPATGAPPPTAVPADQRGQDERYDPYDPDPCTVPLPSRMTPVPIAADPETDPEATLIGPPVSPRAPAFRQPPTGTPQVGTPIPFKNLREAYPNIYRPAPSPSRPQPNAFDDRPASSIDFGSAFDMSHVVRRDALMRRVALAVGIAIALAVLFLVARQW